MVLKKLKHNLELNSNYPKNTISSIVEHKKHESNEVSKMSYAIKIFDRMMKLGILVVCTSEEENRIKIRILNCGLSLSDTLELNDEDFKLNAKWIIESPEISEEVKKEPKTKWESLKYKFDEFVFYHAAELRVLCECTKFAFLLAFFFYIQYLIAREYREGFKHNIFREVYEEWTN